MCAGARRAGGARLTSSPAPDLSLPRHLRGFVLHGDEARRLASSVSGPFWAAPVGYATPPDAERLSALLAWSSAEGIPIIPRGAGTGMPGGNLGPHLIVEVGSGFGGIAWADEERTLLRVGAGVVAAEAERFARDAGRALPFLPSSLDRCRVGGMVANNAAGARSFRWGSTAEFTVGLEGLFAGGSPFRMGPGRVAPEPFASLHSELLAALGPTPPWPAVRKNSSGYALDRYLPGGDPTTLLVGSEGTLAVITGALLRTAPIPEETGLVVVALASPAELTALALAAPELGVDTCEFLGRSLLLLAGVARDRRVGAISQNAYALAFLEVSGSADLVGAGVDAVAARVEQLLGKSASGSRSVSTRDPDEVRTLWALRRGASPTIAREAGRGRISTQFIEDSVVPPAALGAYLEGLDRILAEARLEAVVFGHAGDGNVHVNPLVDPTSAGWIDRVRGALEGVVDLVASLGGTLSGEHGDGRLRAPFIARIWPPEVVRAFRKVKETLDPGRILNPGVILPLPGQDPLASFRPKAPHGEGIEAADRLPQ